MPYDSNGDYIRNPNGDVNIINPIRELDYNTNQRRTFRANASMYAQVDFGKIWEPLEGLSYRLQFGPEFQYYTLGIEMPPEVSMVMVTTAHSTKTNRSVHGHWTT